MTTNTDAELIAALRRSVEIGEAIEVTDEWLAQQAMELNAPVVTWSEPDAWAQRRYFVDGKPVTTVRAGDGRFWRCSPDHRMEWRGVMEIPIGEHVAGCGWVACETDWAVYLDGYNGGPRYYRNLGQAYAEAERHVASARRCSLPIRARLCRLLKRHDGPCIPWA
jgi:hypothetical protein